MSMVDDILSNLTQLPFKIYSIRTIRTIWLTNANFWHENSDIFKKCQNSFFPKKDICVKRYQTTTTFKTKTSKRIWEVRILSISQFLSRVTFFNRWNQFEFNEQNYLRKIRENFVAFFSKLKPEEKPEKPVCLTTQSQNGSSWKHYFRWKFSSGISQKCGSVRII